MIKDAACIYYCAKNQERGLCVGGDMVILCKSSKNGHISAYTQPTHLIFGTVIDTGSIFYHAKNQVGGSCVGGVSKKRVANNTHSMNFSPPRRWRIILRPKMRLYSLKFIAYDNACENHQLTRSKWPLDAKSVFFQHELRLVGLC